MVVPGALAVAAALVVVVVGFGRVDVVVPDPAVVVVVGAPGLAVVVVVGLAPLGSGTVQVIREEPSYRTAAGRPPSGTVNVTHPERQRPAGTGPPMSSGFLAPGPGSWTVLSSSWRRK